MKSNITFYNNHYIYIINNYMSQINLQINCEFNRVYLFLLLLFNIKLIEMINY
jgi:hypothetical protein